MVIAVYSTLDPQVACLVIHSPLLYQHFGGGPTSADTEGSQRVSQPALAPKPAEIAGPQKHTRNDRQIELQHNGGGKHTARELCSSEGKQSRDTDNPPKCFLAIQQEHESLKNNTTMARREV